MMRVLSRGRSQLSAGSGPTRPSLLSICRTLRRGIFPLCYAIRFFFFSAWILGSSGSRWWWNPTIVWATHAWEMDPYSAAASTATGNEVQMGTTLVALCYRDGVVLAADSQTSIGGNNYASHVEAEKLCVLTDTCVLARSGSAAASQALVQAAQHQAQVIQRYRYPGHGGRHLTVSQWAHWIRQQVYRHYYRGGNGGSNAASTVSLLVAGVERVDHDRPTTMNRPPEDTGSVHHHHKSTIASSSSSVKPQIYTITPSGAILCETSQGFAAAGSGSTYILGYLDDYLSKRPRRTKRKTGRNTQINMEARILGNHHDEQGRNEDKNDDDDENDVDPGDLDEATAIQLCRQAVHLAIQRDGSSGGPIRIVVVDGRGIRRVDDHDYDDDQPSVESRVYHMENDREEEPALRPPGSFRANYPANDLIGFARATPRPALHDMGRPKSP